MDVRIVERSGKENQIHSERFTGGMESIPRVGEYITCSGIVEGKKVDRRYIVTDIEYFFRLDTDAELNQRNSINDVLVEIFVIQDYFRSVN